MPQIDWANDWAKIMLAVTIPLPLVSATFTYQKNSVFEVFQPLRVLGRELVFGNAANQCFCQDLSPKCLPMAGSAVMT